MKIINNNSIKKIKKEKPVFNLYLQNNFIEAYYNTTLIQQKIISYIAYHYYENKYSIIKTSFQELIDKTGINNNYISIRKNLIKLQDVKFITNENNISNSSSIVIKTLYDEKSCYTVIELNPMFEKILEFDTIGKTSYTIYDLNNIKNLNSCYSIKLYQLLKQYNSSFRNTRVIPLEKLKLILGCSKYDNENNIISLKYKTFGAFKQKVLDKAKIEINKHCDISFDYEVKKKKKKKVNAIVFFINQKV